MERLLKRIYEARGLNLFLRIVSAVSVAVVVAAYGVAVLIAVLAKEYKLLLGITLPAAIGLVLVTLVRIFIDAPRPYQLYDFYQIKPRKRNGRSFPSRHAYSAFVIFVLLSAVYHPLILGGVLLFSAALCVTRVLLGIHFIRDIAAGALLGILSGILGIVIFL